MIQSLTFPNEIDKLAACLYDTKLLLIGEIHGVEENVDIIKSLIEELSPSETHPLVLAFEWLLSPAEVAQLNSYIHVEADTFPRISFFSDSDGRFTKAHRVLFDTLKRSPKYKCITIEVFDTSMNTDFEYAMANNLAAICAKHPDAFVIAETGVIHARRTPYIDWDGNSIKPMAAFMPDSIKTTTVFIRYASGAVVVEGETYNITHAASQLEGPGDGFDFELCVECAHPADLVLDT